MVVTLDDDPIPPPAPSTAPGPPPASATAAPVPIPTSDFVDYYALIGVAETASAAEITKAIRNARRTWTKRQAASNPERRQEAELRIKEITEAEKILKDPAKRSEFDRRRLNWRPSTPVAAAGGEHHDWPVLARQYLDANNAHAANYAAREAVAVNGADHGSWWVRAHSSFLMGRPADAEYEFNEAIRLQPQNPEYHFDLGEAFAAQAKWQYALGEYEVALGLDAGNPVYKTAIANAYLVNDEPARALQLMEEVVAANPADVFQYYLAWAIHDVTLTKWSKLRNGRYAITSEAQINYTITASNRALKLKFDDAILRHELQENLRLAREAQQEKWFHSDNVLWYLGGLAASFFLIFAYGLGLVTGGLIIWAYYARHRMPVWKHLAQSGAVAAKGI